MNWEQVESKWEQLMDSAKENWAKLSDDDLAADIRQARAACGENPGNLWSPKARS